MKQPYQMTADELRSLPVVDKFDSVEEQMPDGSKVIHPKLPHFSFDAPPFDIFAASVDGVWYEFRRTESGWGRYLT